MKILIDNGHGENTPGKRSPDGTFRIGATSGRTIVGSLSDGKFDLEELTRFDNNLIETYIKIKCVGCGRIVMLPRVKFQKEAKKVIK